MKWFRFAIFPTIFDLFVFLLGFWELAMIFGCVEKCKEQHEMCILIRFNTNHISKSQRFVQFVFAHFQLKPRKKIFFSYIHFYLLVKQEKGNTNFKKLLLLIFIYFHLIYYRPSNFFSCTGLPHHPENGSNAVHWWHSTNVNLDNATSHWFSRNMD